MATRNRSKKVKPTLAKCATGVRGLDEVTFGRLPRGRPTLICGAAGSGKTLLAMEFLVRGALEQGEPGVFMAFEENARELAENVASLGFDLEDMAARRQLFIDHVQLGRAQAGETGEYNLDGLFARLGYAIDSIGAKRVALDTLAVLFAGLSDTGILGAELERLFRWLKDKGVTALVTAERGDGALTRHGLEEYVSDCVIALDQRVNHQVVTRRLRIVKYRGIAHGSNEYPFLIDARGFSVVPLTSLGLEHPALTQRIASGAPKLDAMLGGGYYRGSTVLASGEAGMGKSSLAAHFVDAACRHGERCLYFAFEKSPDQIMRNMRSIGIDFEPWVRKGLLRFDTARPASYGLETHFATMHTRMDEFKPRCVVIDLVTGFDLVGGYSEIKTMLTRLVDMMKARGITALMTDLTPGGRPGRPDRRGHLLADRHLAGVAQHGAGGGAQPRALHHQVAQHEAFQSGTRVRADCVRRRSGGRASGAGGGAAGIGAPGRRGARAGCRAARRARGQARAPDPGAQAQGDRGKNRRAARRVRGRATGGGGGHRRGRALPAGGPAGADGTRRKTRRYRWAREIHEGENVMSIGKKGKQPGSGSGGAERKERYVLRLYVSGLTPNSVRAIAKLKTLCEERLAGRYELEVVDVFQQPELARADQIVAVPTLIRKLPLPVRRLIGDLSKKERVLVEFELQELP